MREAIQSELRDVIHEHGPDCIILMGNDDFVDFVTKRCELTIYQAGVAVAQGEVEYLGVRVIGNGQPGTHGYIVGSTGSMLDWVSTYGVTSQ